MYFDINKILFNRQAEGNFAGVGINIVETGLHYTLFEEHHLDGPVYDSFQLPETH
ncbi:MAG: hypothetical protein WBW72_16925 [Erwinia billingiae]